MDNLDLQLINKLQHGFPICEYPYAVVAKELKTTEGTVIERLQTLLENKTLSRFGPMYHAEHLGGAITLAAMSIPESQFEEVATVVNAMPEIAHNYKRSHELNMWFVVATEKPEQLNDTIKKIELDTGFSVYNMPKQEEFYVGFYLDL
jgi:DNA-binding Lrp family transcriptional regulator